MLNAMGGHLLVISRGWWHALRGLPENPLPAAWGMATRNRIRRQALHGALFAGASLLACFLALFILRELNPWPAHVPRFWINDGQPHLYVINWAFANMASAWIWLVLLCWTGSRFVGCMQLALGFLNELPSRRISLGLDDMLAAAQLSDYEILVGFLMHCLQRLWLPLVLLCLATGVASAGISQLVRDDFNRTMPVNLLLFYTLAALPLLLHALLATSALLLLGVSLSPGNRDATAGMSGGLLHGLLQLFMMAASMLILLQIMMGRPFPATMPLHGIIDLVRLIGLLLTGLLLYLARHLNPLRLVLLGGWVVVTAALHLAVCLPLLIVYAYPMAPADPLFLLTECLKPLNVISIEQQFWSGLYTWEALELNDWHNETEVRNFLRDNWHIMLWQLAWLAMFAEFARDAVRRRKWGSA